MAIALRASYGTSSSKVQTSVAVQAGDVVLVLFSVGGGMVSATCADSAGNTYSEIGTGFAASASSIHAHAFKAVAASAGTITVTVTTSATSVPTIVVHVYSGCDGTLDGYAGKAETSGSTSHTTNSITTTNANDVLVTWWFQDNAGSRTLTDGSGFTQRQQKSSDGSTVYQYSYDKIVSATGAYSQSVTGNGSCIYGSLILALKAASAGPTYNPSCMMAAF